MEELQVPTRSQLESEVTDAEESYSSGYYLVRQALDGDDLTGW